MPYHANVKSQRIVLAVLAAMLAVAAVGRGATDDPKAAIVPALAAVGVGNTDWPSRLIALFGLAFVPAVLVWWLWIARLSSGGRRGGAERAR
jgi:hypothetical protein